MIITVASYKGGVGKTTTALHLAAFFQRLAPTLLVDGDAICTSIKWSQRGAGTGLPFTVVDEKQTAIATRDGVTLVSWSAETGTSEGPQQGAWRLYDDAGHRVAGVAVEERLEIPGDLEDLGIGDVGAAHGARG